MNSNNDHLASMPLMNEKPFSQVSWDEGPQVFQKIGPKQSMLNKSDVNPQAHPAHYNHGKYEVIDVIEDWKLGFNLGNVVKYLARADHKGTPTADLYKSLFYLNREIAHRERNAT